MATALHSKSRISRQEWREMQSYEDRNEARRAIDPTAWERQARHVVFANPWSDFTTFAPPGQPGHVAIDAGAMVARSHLLVLGHRVAVDASAFEGPGQWEWEGTDSYDRATLERVRDLLKSLAFIAQDTFGYQLDVPHPAPADEGSIDVFFEGAERNLLINTPQDDGLVTYFGSDRSGSTFGGSLSLPQGHRDLMTLAAWIMRIR